MTQRPRKRSRHAALVLMVPATSLLMSACSQQQPDQAPAVVYSSVEECKQQHPDAVDQCEADYKQAAALHPQVAPKYLSQQECEADFGVQRCEIAPQQRSGGGSFFMPMMMGYMASQMFSRPTIIGQPGSYSAGPAGNPRDNVRRDDNNQTSGFAGGVATQPLYRSRDDAGTFRTADNYAVASKSGAVSVNPQAVTGVRAGGVRSIGGFGSTAAGIESFGS